MAFKITPSLLEQLGKALMELQSHSDTTSDTVTFTEISNHFHDLESKLLKKHSELESKEQIFKQEESTNRQSLAAKVAAVAKKEQDMFDRIQLLKDAAVAAITEARANHLPPPVDDVTNDMDTTTTTTKVIIPNSPDRDTDDGGGGDSVTFYDELTRLCDGMDAKGLG
ncbi:hypothetical protein L1887_36192 [Cichorium endivia]|nr:hypothetical protein L1887_36192 [Cichorium endivia]